MAEAASLEALYQEYKDDGFVVISLLAENNSGSTPSQSDLEDWADNYGSNHPLVADDGWSTTYAYASGSSIYLPTTHLIGPGAEVIAVDSTMQGWSYENAVAQLLSR